MSSKSSYTDDQILQRIVQHGYERLEGSHVNGDSVHVLRHACGMVNVKTSKALLSKKAGCRYIPCVKKGKLSLLYVRSVAERKEIDQVTLETEVALPLDRLEITADDRLVWTKAGLTMTQSWNEVRKRALSVKNGVFFQADGTRRKPQSPRLTHAILAGLAAPRQLVLPAHAPQVRKQKASYVHRQCSKPVSLTFLELEKWRESDCPHCRPPKQVALEKFQSFLSEVDMVYEGTLELKAGSSQVAREQRVAIRCKACRSTNAERTYDEVRYRGFIYCDNTDCVNTYRPEDKSAQPNQYYIDLFRQHQVASFSQAEQLFPKSTRYIRHHSESSSAGQDKKVYKFHVVGEALGFDRNMPAVDISDADLRKAFQEAIEKGATTIGSLRSMLPPVINSFLNRMKLAGNPVHHRILEAMDFRYKRGFQVASLDDAISAVLATKCESWGEVVTRFPGLGEQIIRLGFKEGVLETYDWPSLVNYSDLSDEAILERARVLCEDNRLTNISELERDYSSLVLNIRKRKLIDTLCEHLGFQKPKIWQGVSYDQIVAHVRERGFISLTLWSWECSGSYKYALAQNWVRDIGKQLEWGKLIGLNGYSYPSLPEAIVANVLFLSDIEFSDHPRIENFPGFGGGKPFADFLLPDPLWIEVWAYERDATPPRGVFEDYPARRCYKEQGYETHRMPLCSIEGGLLHRACVIDGAERQRGLGSFVAHVCEQLTKHGYPIECTPEFANEIRKSIGSESDSPVIGL